MGILTTPEPEAQSWLGLPVFEVFEFLPGKTRAGLAYNGMKMPFTTTVEISRRKNIVTTVTTGGEGEVNEWISRGVFAVAIRGLLVNEQDDLPEELIRQLVELESVADSIEVRGRLFTIAGIDRLIIQEMSIGSVQGYQNVRSFTLGCRAEKPLEIKIRDGI